MDTFRSYTDRVLQGTPIVLNYQLVPFSLGHSLLLKAANSKFVSNDYNSFLEIGNIRKELVTNTKDIVTEFLYAVLVCSTTYDDFILEFRDRKYVNAIKELKDSINDFDLAKEIHRFAHYLNRGTDAPLFDVVEDESANNISTNPISSEESIKKVLMGECGYSREEVMNLPLTETLSAYLLYAQDMGSIKLKSKEVFELETRLGIHK